MDRRSFLVGAGGLALAQLTSGCSSWNQPAFKVRLLKDSIPAQLVGEFRQGLKQPAALKFDPEQQLKKLFSHLQTWKLQAGKKDTQPQWRFPFIGGRTPAVADLVTLGDYWLETAIRQKLIQRLEIQQLNGWTQLPQRWQELVVRDSVGQLSDSGLVWGAPYRWGSTVIAYNRDKFKELGLKPPKDWEDLWREELRDRISLLDQPREVIGLTLKKLGHSYNTTNLSQVPNLKDELRALHQQVKFYSSDNYLQPLILGDTWLAVGWSTDILPLRTRYRQIQPVVPSSGTALWADLWVQPASLAAGGNSVETGDRRLLRQQWIDFCWQPKQAREISLFTNAASPIITDVNRADLPEDLRKNPLLLPDSAVLDNSEFLKPLPKEAVKEYEDLWKEIRLLNNESSGR
jgi:putative spermidine/putrescine transport system substrate-binding protein